MSDFLGEYEVTLDAKGRFLLPANFKKQLPEGEAGYFVITKWFENCLTLYPKNVWDGIYENIKKLNDFELKVRQFKRNFLSGALKIEPDTAGRLLIPANLKEYAGLEKDIVLASLQDKIEIWDKKKREQLFESFSSEEFSSIAEEVMGSGKRKDSLL